MMNELLLSPLTMGREISRQARQKRLSQNLTQQSLSSRSGVSYSVIKKFELTGKISLESLLKIAFALGYLGDFLKLFEVKEDLTEVTLDELLKDKKRKRGSN